MGKKAVRYSALLALAVFAATPIAAQDSILVAVDTSGSEVEASVSQDSQPTISTDSLLPVPEPSILQGPLPKGMRYTFTRDSIVWNAGITLADLLVSIPGLYVARTGFLGQPELVMFGGRGGAAIELYWDGLPILPVGRDSIHHDLGRVNLTYVERVDVIVLPSTIRVFLVSSRHASQVPRSVIRFIAGDYSTGGYAGLFQKRIRNGIGINLAADFVGTDGASGTGRNDQTFDLWARFDWLPSDRIGASYQIRRQNHKRDPAGEGPLVPSRLGDRTDFLFTAFAGSLPNGLGTRVELGVASSEWVADSIDLEVPDQKIRQANINIRHQFPNLTVGVGGRLGDARVTSGLSAQLGWAPFSWMVVAGDARWDRHDRDRTSLRAFGTAGIHGGPFALVGVLQFGDVVQAPAIAADSAQKTVDRSIRASFRTQPLSGVVSLVRRDVFLPLPYTEIGVISSFDSSAAATYLVLETRLASSRALAVDAWYSTPIAGEPGDLQPRQHGRVRITYRSKFWRTFRSGAFDLKVQLGWEFWSRSDAGFDMAGEPVTLVGATFSESLLQIQLVDFIIFGQYRNMENSTESYVPGLPYPPRASLTWGVKWEFSN